MKTAAVLWTGGKDSVLAWREARARYDVACCVTFVPDPPEPFVAHPLELVRAQAAAAGLPHRSVPVSAPYEQGYEDAIDGLARDGIEVLVTGDIDRVHGQDNWIVQRARGRVEVDRPLWQADRRVVLERMLAEGWDVRITLAYHEHFAPPGVAGRALDAELVAGFVARQEQGGLDACGENGEYHTCVLWAPGFAQRLELVGARVEQAEAYAHLVFDGVRAADRPLTDSSGDRA